MQQRTIVERFESDIVHDLATVKLEFELAKNVDRVLAIQFTSDQDTMIFHRGSISMALNGGEVFAEGWQVKKLMAGLNVSPNDRMYNIQEDAGVERGNGKINITYTDSPSSVQAHSDYRFQVYVKSTVKEV